MKVSMVLEKNRSTSMALLELTEEIANAIDKNKSLIGVFINLKKAFDTVNHNLLLKKFKCVAYVVLYITG